MLEIIGLSKNIDEKLIFNNISFDLPETSLVFLLGPNGSGKSSLLYMLAGLDNDYDGTIKFNGTDIRDKKLNYNSNIMLLNQDSQIFEDLSIYKNITLCYKATKDDVEKILQRVNLPVAILDSLGSTLSQGEKARVALARAILLKPKILLVDEITANLDAENSEIVIQILKEIALNSLVIFPTHEINTKDDVSVITIKDCRIINNIDNSAENSNQQSHTTHNRTDKFNFIKNNKTIFVITTIFCFILCFFTSMSGIFSTNYDNAGFTKLNKMQFEEIVNSSNSLYLSSSLDYSQELQNDLAKIPAENKISVGNSHVAVRPDIMYLNCDPFSSSVLSIPSVDVLPSSIKIIAGRLPQDGEIMITDWQYSRLLKHADDCNLSHDTLSKYLEESEKVVGIFHYESSISEATIQKIDAFLDKYTFFNDYDAELVKVSGFFFLSLIGFSIDSDLYSNASFYFLNDESKKIVLSNSLELSQNSIENLISSMDRGSDSFHVENYNTYLTILFFLGLMIDGLLIIYVIFAIISLWFANKKRITLLKSLGTSDKNIEEQILYFFLLGFLAPSLLASILGPILGCMIVNVILSSMLFPLHGLRQFYSPYSIIPLAVILVSFALYILIFKAKISENNKHIVKQLRKGD